MDDPALDRAEARITVGNSDPHPGTALRPSSSRSDRTANLTTTAPLSPSGGLAVTPAAPALLEAAAEVEGEEELVGLGLDLVAEVGAETVDSGSSSDLLEILSPGHLEGLDSGMDPLDLENSGSGRGLEEVTMMTVI